MSIDPVAAYAAVVSTLVAVIQIYKWSIEGARLRSNVIGDAETFGAIKAATDLSIITVTNVGDRTTTITHLALAYWPTWYNQAMNRKGRAFLVSFHSEFPGQDLPYRLEVGTQWMGAARHNEEFKTLARSGRLYFHVYHSGAKKPHSARIRIKPA